MATATQKATSPARFSAEEQTAILDQLAQIVTSAPFRSSKRCFLMLEYCVQCTLSGRVERLRERQLGIHLFSRPVGYETSGDPIVRMTASEVRKRLAQFYRINEGAPRVKISLPLGSYVAEFRFLEPKAVHDPDAASLSQDCLSEVSKEGLQPQLFVPLPTGGTEPSLAEPRSSRTRMLRAVLMGSVAALIIVAATMSRGLERKQSLQQAFWKPMLHNRVELKAIIGQSRPVPEIGHPASLGTEIREGEESIGLGDASTAIRLCGEIAAMAVPCRTEYSRKVSLQNLRGAPLLLIGALNNQWTLRATNPLRFRFDPQRRAIVDTKTQTVLGMVNFDLPRSSINTDYSIIARFRSNLTDDYVVVVGGIGPMSTEAAAVFLSSSEGLQELWAKAPSGKPSENMEAVLATQVVEGRPGHTRVIAADFW